MEGDLRINVPPANKHGISQCYGPAVSAIRRLKVKMLIVGTKSELGDRFNSHTVFVFVLMCT